MAVVWRAMIGFSAAGFATVFLLREVPMQKVTDETYGLKTDGADSGDEEADARKNSSSESVQLKAVVKEPLLQQAE